MKRWELIQDLINEYECKDIAEIGVNVGETANFIAQNCPVRSYILVDRVMHRAELEETLKKPNVTFIEKDSAQASHDIETESLDLVFIDADHTYEAVKLDIMHWIMKLRPGGIICGHDYGNSKWPGVKKAIDELFENRVVVGPEGTYMWIVFLNGGKT